MTAVDALATIEDFAEELGLDGCDPATDRAHEAVIAEERAFHAINDEEVGHG